MNTRFLKDTIRPRCPVIGRFERAFAGCQRAVPMAKATVPFEFAAGGAMMPAGEYTIDVPDLSGVIVLHGAAGNSVALLTTFSESFPAHPPPS